MPPAPLPDPDPDADILSGVAAGDGRAVRALVDRKLRRLLSLAVRILGDRGEAEDVAQETFVQVWKHAGRWKPGQARFDTWIHQVALNLCRDRLRRRRDTTPVDDESMEVVDPHPLPDEAAHAADRSALVGRALAALPLRQREALVLQYYQDLSNIDAAALMGIGVDALESLLARARRNMRARLPGDLLEELR